MTKFFRIERPYRFEYNDLRALITIINVALIMRFGLSIAWFGLAVAIIGIIKDLVVDRHINGLLMHIANVILNIYFIMLIQKMGASLFFDLKLSENSEDRAGRAF